MSLTDVPDGLDAAITASLRTRREKLVRRVRNQRIRTRVALGLSGCIAVLALTAYLIADYAAARSLIIISCAVFGLSLAAGAAARKMAVDAVREADQHNGHR